MESQLEEMHVRAESSMEKAAAFEAELAENKKLSATQQETLAAQEELISNMDRDASKSRALRDEVREKEKALAEIQIQLDTRDKLIETLQSDSDELRKTRRLLRESQAEISRLKILAAPGADSPEIAELKHALHDKEKAIGALSLAVRKREESIKELTAEASTWHERYQKLQDKFLGTGLNDTVVTEDTAKKA